MDTVGGMQPVAQTVKAPKKKTITFELIPEPEGRNGWSSSERIVILLFQALFLKNREFPGNKEVGEILGVREYTIRNHRTNIRQKVDIPDHADGSVIFFLDADRPLDSSDIAKLSDVARELLGLQKVQEEK